MGIYALLKLPKKDPIAFGIIFYLASLSIVSNLLFSVGTNMSERFVFMPSVGFVLIIAVLLSRLLKENTKIKTGLIAIGVITLLFSAKTIIRNPAWQDKFKVSQSETRETYEALDDKLSIKRIIVDKSGDEITQVKKIRRRMLQLAMELLLPQRRRS